MKSFSLEQIKQNPIVVTEFIEYESVEQVLIDNWLENIRKNLSNPDKYMDKGQSGKVYSLDDFTCAKAIKVNPIDLVELNMRRFSNSPHQEALIHFEISKLREKGICCPQFLAYLKGTIFDVLVIKKLQAIKLEDILERKKSLPKTTTIQQISEQMLQQMNILHENGFAHRDMEPRNWMVDEISGQVFMIDFGWAIAISDENKEQAIAKDKKSVGDILQSLTKFG